MLVLVGIVVAAAVAVALVGVAGLVGRLPENSFVGVRTEQTLSDPLLWRIANRVSGPALLAAGVIIAGGALVSLALPAPWSYAAVVVAVIAGVFPPVSGRSRAPGRRRSKLVCSSRPPPAAPPTRRPQTRPQRRTAGSAAAVVRAPSRACATTNPTPPDARPHMRRLLTKLPIDGFIVAILATVGVAALFPAQGGAVPVLDRAVTVAIAVLFFLYGARIHPRDAWTGLKHWRLHVAILAFTFVVFPLIGMRCAFCRTRCCSRVCTPACCSDPASVTGAARRSRSPRSPAATFPGRLSAPRCRTCWG